MKQWLPVQVPQEVNIHLHFSENLLAWKFNSKWDLGVWRSYVAVTLEIQSFLIFYFHGNPENAGLSMFLAQVPLTAEA